MKSLKMVVAVGCVLGLASLATPAFAQHRGGASHGGGGGRGAAVSRGGGARTAGPARSGGAVSRGPGFRGPMMGARTYGNYGTYRGYSPYRGYRVVAPVRFIRPYYTFRPRVNIGFGIWAGDPFAYSYGFYDPFFYGGYGYPGAYPYPSYGYPAYGPPYGYPAYGPPPAQAYPNYPPQSYPPSSSGPSWAYPPGDQSSTYPPAGQGSVQAQPGQQNMGGLSFDITPSTAQVFIDGQLAGTVGQFTPDSEPLGVASGRHHLEVRAPGYETLMLDIDIVAGQVIPYQGSLQRR